MKEIDAIVVEWNKIKEHNIFDSFDEFKNIYATNPNGKCFRKYANYPWSKENFFFGTYEELMTYLKTTDEIPFYIQEKKGAKVFHLTLISFFRDGDRKIHANCLCDCGTKVVKSYDVISKGNAHSCGCSKGAGKKKETFCSIYDAIPDIIDTYWDFQKNIDNPSQIPVDSEAEFWFKGYSSSYKLPIKSLIQVATSTSFPEQAIRFFLEKNGINVINRYQTVYKNKKYEIDLFLPKYNIGIEYDGSFWHSQKNASEREKNKALEESGIKLIRIREKGLKSTGVKNGFEILMKKSVSNTSLSQVLNELFAYIEAFVDIDLEKVSPERIQENTSQIKKQYSLCKFGDTIAAHWLSSYWSAKNKIEPQFIPLKTSEKYFFECPQGAIFYHSPNYILSKIRVDNIENLSKCVFDRISFCSRAEKIQKGLQAKILSATFTKGHININFCVKNNNDTFFTSPSLVQYGVLIHDAFRSFSGRNIAISSTSAISLNDASKQTCQPTYNYIIGKNGNFRNLLEYSKRTYSVDLTFDSTIINQPEFDVLLIFNLFDQMNYVYKMCLLVKKTQADNVYKTGVFTWRMYNSFLEHSETGIHDFLDPDDIHNVIDKLVGDSD